MKRRCKSFSVVGLVVTSYLLLPSALAADNPWAHFIGKYDCWVESEVNIGDPRQSPILKTFPDKRLRLDMSVGTPILVADPDRCADDADQFAKAIRSGGGTTAFAARGVMERECSDKLDLVIAKFLMQPFSADQHLHFTDEFADLMDHEADGGINFHGDNLSDVFHLAGDWHFTYTRLLSKGGLTWFAGQCVQK